MRAALLKNYRTYAIGSWAEAVAIADLNGDGRKDVVLTTSSNGNTNDHSILIFFQNAAGQLAPPVRYDAGADAFSVAVGDFSGNGRNDIAVGRKELGIRLFWQDPPGVFANHTDHRTENAFCICTGDFNHDGRPDLAGVGWSSSKVDVFLQTAKGKFAGFYQYAAKCGGYNDIQASDVNGDGLCDIVVMSGQGMVPNLAVLLQASHGFAPQTNYSVRSKTLTRGMAIGDVDGDGRNEIVVSCESLPFSRIAVFHQTAKGSLELSNSYDSTNSPQAVAIADLNVDGRQDVLTLHGGFEKLGVYFQNPNHLLGLEQLFSIPECDHYNPQGLAVGDINGDGKPDVVVADPEHGLVVLTN